MSQQYRIGSHKTTVKTENGTTKVVYWSTPVVSFNDKEIILNTGNYRTNTTKTRMNQTSSQFGLGFYVFQKNYDWFVEFKGNIEPFGNYEPKVYDDCHRLMR